MRRKRNCGDADAMRVSSVSGARGVVTSRSRDDDDDDTRVKRRRRRQGRRRFWCNDDDDDDDVVGVNDGDGDAVVMSRSAAVSQWITNKQLFVLLVPVLSLLLIFNADSAFLWRWRANRYPCG
jgi:hypothetical protein